MSEFKEEEIEDLEKSAQDASVIKLVNQIFSEAVSSRATDIHIEPWRENVKVRFRVDGVMNTSLVLLVNPLKNCSTKSSLLVKGNSIC